MAAEAATSQDMKTLLPGAGGTPLKRAAGHGHKNFAETADLRSFQDSQTLVNTAFTTFLIGAAAP
jgi:hypothetical protein